MSTTLKASVHQLVEEIENEQLLETLRDFLSLRKKSQPGKLWEDLPEDKKQGILLALQESEDESSLMTREEFLKPKK
ncbi:hypothetical protein [Algoriphagus sp. A40]|uniref:hypothetical protein n=1 Tax=Algoriphagus sp. A40 TaxID=1945863 RepID=UPI00098626FC|nr:hypothetical protein [Algoriphagus sp. A40]OOG77875.1 hypothetical protein B0E43_03690 [Algoriphagus sp. A40]